MVGQEMQIGVINRVRHPKTFSNTANLYILDLRSIQKDKLKNSLADGVCFGITVNVLWEFFN